MRMLAAASLILFAAAASDDQAAFQGTWAVLAYDQNGQSPDAGTLKRMQVVIKADNLTIQPRLVAEYKPVFKDGKADKEVVFSLDAARADEIRIRLNPDKGWIDLGDDKPTKGLYVLDGAVLKICFAAAGKNRPKKFPEQPKKGVVRMVLTKSAK